MGPAFRLDLATRHFLQSIVPDGRCCAEPFFEIARLDQVAFTLGVISPDTGITIGLEFHSDRQGISFDLRHLSLEAMHFFCDAEEILHVMADLMSDHISLREVARCSESMRHLVEEGKV